MSVLQPLCGRLGGPPRAGQGKRRTGNRNDLARARRSEAGRQVAVWSAAPWRCRLSCSLSDYPGMGFRN